MKKSRNFLSKGILFYRKQSVRNKAGFWVLLLVIILLIVPTVLRQGRPGNPHPARMYFSDVQAGLTPGQIFPVEVRLQTTGTAVNAVSSTVEFNPNQLEVVSMTTEHSFCTFYLDNTFDNIKGKVIVSCGVPNPGFVGDSVIVHLDMRAKSAGSTTISLSPDSQALANDGKGTNITQDFSDLTLDIKQLL